MSEYGVMILKRDLRLSGIKAPPFHRWPGNQAYSGTWDDVELQSALVTDDDRHSRLIRRVEQASTPTRFSTGHRPGISRSVRPAPSSKRRVTVNAGGSASRNADQYGAKSENLFRRLSLDHKGYSRAV